MKMEPLISILIPAYNEEEWIGETLRSICESFAALEHSSYEIIVCDNHSTDRTSEIAKSKGAQVVFEPHNQIAKARNAAAKTAKGKLLIFMDADTLLNAQVLEQTIEHFESGKVGAGGAIPWMHTQGLPWHKKIFVWVCCWLWAKISIGFQFAAGSYLYCHREAWVEIGGFNEELYVSEEIDFSKKLKVWCKKRGLTLSIIPAPFIFTSSRKVWWYTPWQGIKQALRILFNPESMKKKDHCHIWYTRPTQNFVKECSKK